MSVLPSGRGRLLRYSADWLPVCFVLGAFALHVAVYWFMPPLLALAALLPIFALSTMVGAFNHHHQHVNVFNSRVLNRVYDVLLTSII
jgi:hypothetical protein